jgi:ligand-binding SRPBCC domain-containing protein
MTVHTFEASMFLPLARDRVFAFFSDASNLARITPPEMGFRIRTPLPIEMGAGTVIDYRVRVFGIPLR